jgi:hypothetical protein
MAGTKKKIEGKKGNAIKKQEINERETKQSKGIKKRRTKYFCTF